MYCPNCGKQIPDSASFCPECGARIEYTAKKPEQSYGRNSHYRDDSRPKRSSGTGLLTILLLAAVLITAGFFILRGSPEILFRKKETPQTPLPSAVSSSPVSSGTQPETSGQSTEPSAPSGGNSSQTSDSPVQQNPLSNASGTGAGTYQEDLMPQSVDNLTAVIFDDFIYPERMLEQGLPEHYDELSLYDAAGAWKYELLFEESGYKEIGRCMIDFGQSAVLFDLYPEISAYDNEMYPVTREEIGYQTYAGEISEDAFVLQVPDRSSTAVLGPFIRIEGTEFAFGSVVAGDSGNILTLLLTRP